MLIDLSPSPDDRPGGGGGHLSAASSLQSGRRHSPGAEGSACNSVTFPPWELQSRGAGSNRHPRQESQKEESSGRGGRAVGGLRTLLPADAEDAPPAASWQLFWPAPKEGSRTQESRPGPDSGIRPVPDLRRMHALHIYTRATKKQKHTHLLALSRLSPEDLVPIRKPTGPQIKKTTKPLNSIILQRWLLSREVWPSTTH